ncbi:cytochrome P450 1A1-like [Watersipora subatra]|uniref:cytochrome P450 1A1-like n=1 Tax=Watersipora subatra TaxID=2589382 RepID=UPI00355BA344
MDLGVVTTFDLLAAVFILLATYLFVKWYRDPIRKIPGPPGLPILGNVLSLNPSFLHIQLFEMARKYGAVMKLKIFTYPIVVINSKDACLEALIKAGTDYLGRPPMKRMSTIAGKDIGFHTFDEDHVMLKRIFTKAIKAYGPGIAHLENVMQETIQDMVDSIDQKGDQAIDTNELVVGYVCCVLASMMFGEKFAYDDEVCKKMHRMNTRQIEAGDPMSSAAILDAFPFLFNFKFLFADTHRKIEDAMKLVNEFTKSRLDQAKASYDANNKRGCLDYFIEIQKAEMDKDGKPQLDDEGIKGLLLDFIRAGLETSRRSLAQIFLDLLHDPGLQKRLQDELDTQLNPTHIICLKDKEKLPQMEAYLLEQFRYLSQAPVLLPHMTLRDTELIGYKIPANTVVLINAFHTAHNPDIYEDPFVLKPDRFLDKEGKCVDRDHPLRQNFLGFGSGRRACPGELLARSRIFLFLANILQKYNVELIGKLPERDVRKYPMSILLSPPSTHVKFVRRQ